MQVDALEGVGEDLAVTTLLDAVAPLLGDVTPDTASVAVEAGAGFPTELAVDDHLPKQLGRLISRIVESLVKHLADR